MSWLISIAVSNAVVASLLAVIAWIICRNTKSLTLAHTVWVLVLIKLVTPPIVDLPLPVLPEWTTSGSATIAPLDPATSEQLNVSNSLGDQQFTSKPNELANGAQGGPAVIAAKTTAWNLVSVLLWIWLVGAILVASYLVLVTTVMARLMSQAVPDPRIDRAMNRIARAANVSNYPTARVVPWVTSPMLWGLRGTSVVVLPSGLLESMDDEAADTLLMHELAHFQRGDQWVRILEVVVSVLFWWHAVVWVARHQIEIFEEQSCDAWVVAQDPENRRRYAEALLDTVDFISDAQSNAMPVAASGLGQVRLLKKRVKAILEGEKPVGLTANAWLILSSFLILLPLNPILLAVGNVNTSVSNLDAIEAVTSTELSEAPLLDKDQPTAEEFEIPAPGPEYARANSAYGTYELIARRGYEVELRKVVGGVARDLSSHRISCAAFIPPDGNAPEFVAGSCDGSIWRFDCESGSAKDSLGQFGSPINSVDISRDGALLVAGTAGGSILLMEMANEKNVRKIEAKAPVRCVRFSNDTLKLVVTIDTTWDKQVPGRVEVWDTRTLDRLRTVSCPTAVGASALDSAGNVLTVEWNGVMRTWSPTGAMLSATQQSKDAVSAATFSPNAVNLETLGMAEAK